MNAIIAETLKSDEMLPLGVLLLIGIPLILFGVWAICKGMWILRKEKRGEVKIKPLAIQGMFAIEKTILLGFFALALGIIVTIIFFALLWKE